MGRLARLAQYGAGTLGGMVMVAAQVAPKAARTNIAAWAQDLGLDKLTPYLEDPHTDRTFTLAGLTLVAAAAFWLLAGRRKALPLAFYNVREVGTLYKPFAAETDPSRQPAVFDCGEVTFTNTSKTTSLNLEIYLVTKWPDWELKLRSGPVASGFRRLGRDDLSDHFNSLRGDPPDQFFENPTHLDPGQALRRKLVFIHEFMDDHEKLDMVRRDMTFEIYKSRKLVVTDLGSGITIETPMPASYRGAEK